MRALNIAILASISSLTGCVTELGSTEHRADDAIPIHLEGAEVMAGLDEEGTSPVQTAEEPFVRLGVLWDSTTSGNLEVRTSADGATWSEWTAPIVTFEEEIEHAGHVDAPPGQTALHYQYRTVGTIPPDFLAFDPIEELGPAEGLPLEEVAEDGEIGAASAALTRDGLQIHTRAEWGARSPRCTTPMTPWRATIHHTVTPTRDSMSVPARLRQIQAYHMFTQGWCDIGYNFMVSRDGRVWRGRGGRRLGAHASGANSGNVGISFLGTYTSTSITDTQIRNAGKLLAELNRLYPGISLNRTDIKGHRQHGGTSCPGDRLFGQIDRIVASARGYRY